jgi:hypothetical protein
MIGKQLYPTKNAIDEAKDRTELFYDFIVNYIVRQPVYKLNKDYAKYIDLALENLAKAKEEI